MAHAWPSSLSRVPPVVSAAAAEAKSRSLRLVLDVANSPRQARSPPRTATRPRSDPNDEPQQPALGCTAHSRRVAETGYRDYPTHCRQIHGSTSKTPLTNL